MKYRLYVLIICCILLLSSCSGGETSSDADGTVTGQRVSDNGAEDSGKKLASKPTALPTATPEPTSTPEPTPVVIPEDVTETVYGDVIFRSLLSWGDPLTDNNILKYTFVNDYNSVLCYITKSDISGSTLDYKKISGEYEKEFLAGLSDVSSETEAEAITVGGNITDAVQYTCAGVMSAGKVACIRSFFRVNNDLYIVTYVVSNAADVSEPCLEDCNEFLSMVAVSEDGPDPADGDGTTGSVLEDVVFSTPYYSTSGKGDERITGFSQTYLHFLRIKNTGKKDFRVNVRYKDHRDEAVYFALVDTSKGNYNGDLFVNLSSDYSLDIKSDGEWSVEAYYIGESSTDTFSGQGSTVTPACISTRRTYRIEAEGDIGSLVIQAFYEDKRLGLNYHLLVNTHDVNYKGNVKANLRGEKIFFVIKCAPGTKWSIRPI